MTEEQMRIAIAEACGWIHHHMRPSETERLQKKWRYLSDLPDYLNDLNDTLTKLQSALKTKGIKLTWHISIAPLL